MTLDELETAKGCIYLVVFRDASGRAETITRPVHLIDGVSTFADIPRIIATNYGPNLTIVSATLAE